MASKVDGFDDLFNTLQELGNIGNKVGKKAVEEASKIVLEQEKEDAPIDVEGTTHGKDALKITSIKKYKGGSTYGNIGIDGTNWDECKHLYYQHYGYELWKNGKRVEPHLLWMDKSFNKCKKKAEDVMLETAESELNKILR